MKNGDKIRSMTDAELSDFMCRCERQEVPYYQNCIECTERICDECRMEWLKEDPDEFKEDPRMFSIILGTVDKLCERESTYLRATLAKDIYKILRKEKL